MKKTFFILLSFFAFVVVFQNCSKVNFLKEGTDEEIFGGVTTTVPGNPVCDYSDFDSSQILASKDSVGGARLDVNDIVLGDQVYFWSAINEPNMQYLWTLEIPGAVPAMSATPSVAVSFASAGNYQVSLSIQRELCPTASPPAVLQIAVSNTNTYAWYNTRQCSSTSCGIDGYKIFVCRMNSTTVVADSECSSRGLVKPVLPCQAAGCGKAKTNGGTCNNPKGHVLCWSQSDYNKAKSNNCLSVNAISTYYSVYLDPGSTMSPAEYRAANPDMCSGYTP